MRWRFVPAAWWGARLRGGHARPVAAAALAFVLAAGGCGGSAADGARETDRSQPTPVFLDVAARAGINHVHHKPRLDPRVDNIGPWLSSVGAAVAAGDFDNDGRIDLYVTDSDKGQPNRLYRNLGDGTFRDVAPAAGVAAVNDDGGTSMDCIWADVDNDGWQDLYLVRWGRDRLFRNDGDGTFTDVTLERFRTAAGEPGTPWANGNAVVALDYDRDGRLDLYVGNYFAADVDLWRLDSTRIMHDDFERARNAGANFLYHQEPDGTFTDVAVPLGVDDTGWTLAVGAADLDNDGWTDLYVANDFGPDRLFYGDGRGGFADVSATAIGPDTKKGMNVDFGDFNGDGWLDVYVTNITTAHYLREGNMLWRNNGPGADGVTRFMDVASESGTWDGGWGWGAKWLDHDNDGDLDLFSVNGFISAGAGSYWYDLASWTVLGKDPADALNWPTIGDRSFSGHEPDRLWRNDGFETFREVAREVGLASARDGRGIAVLDFDDDGDLDLYVANQGQPPHLYENRVRTANHWLRVRLVGDPSRRTSVDAVGARVTLVAGGRRQIRERDGGAGFAGQSDPRLHFGLAADARADLLEVRWPDGGLQVLEGVAADREVVVRQEPSAYAARAPVEVAAPRPLDRSPAGTSRVPRLSAEELDRLLSAMEAELRRDPSRHELAHAYRRRAAENDAHDRPIAFFRELCDRDPRADGPRLELAVAYVDKLPTCGGLAAIVCKGTLARKSLDVLDELLARDEASWIARYARGMNHLHWPRALRHSAEAVADFGRCLELQLARDNRSGRPFYERIYVLLGDAHAKNSEFEQARRAWRNGLEAFPGSRALVERLALDGDDELLAFVERARSLEATIDTDLSFAAAR